MKFDKSENCLHTVPVAQRRAQNNDIPIHLSKFLRLWPMRNSHYIYTLEMLGLQAVQKSNGVCVHAKPPSAPFSLPFPL